jgi:hypothetical protein
LLMDPQEISGSDPTELSKNSEPSHHSIFK